MKRLMMLIAALIVYGSLFPWHVVPRHVEGGPVWYLLHRWDTATNSYLAHDIAVNIALYVPLGLVAHFVFKGPFTPLLAALALSTAVELTQIYVPGRQATMVDVLANTSGAALGASIAVFLRALPRAIKLPRIHPAVAWVFLLVLVAWLSLTSVRGAFEWLPFASLLRGNPQSGLLVLAAKATSCAGVIGLFRLSGMGAMKATLLATAAAALAARNGVTEPVIALLAGFALSSLFPETETQSRSAG